MNWLIAVYKDTIELTIVGMMTVKLALIDFLNLDEAESISL